MRMMPAILVLLLSLVPTQGRAASGISGTLGFIVGTELVPGALDVKGLKDLIARAGEKK